MPLPNPKNNHPYWYYRHIPLVAGAASMGSATVICPILDRYDYLMQGFFCSYPSDTVTPDESPIISVQLIQNERSIPVFEGAVPVRDISSPGPCRAAVLSQNRGVRGYVIINYVFSYSSLIQFLVVGQAAGIPEFLDLVIVGRMIKRGGV